MPQKTSLKERRLFDARIRSGRQTSIRHASDDTATVKQLAHSEKGATKMSSKNSTKSTKAAKPVARKATTWAGIKKGMTRKFFCCRCRKAIEAKVNHIAKGTKGTKALRAYATCKCGANVAHPIAA